MNFPSLLYYKLRFTNNNKTPKAKTIKIGPDRSGSSK